MSVYIGILFHWSPADRRVAILRDGLKPYSEPVVNTASFPHICFGTTPSSAWGLSGDMEWATEIDEWDLWQYAPADGDEISIRGDFVPYVREVRVHNAVPANRLWWVGVRSPRLLGIESKPVPLPAPKKKPKKKG